MRHLIIKDKLSDIPCGDGGDKEVAGLFVFWLLCKGRGQGDGGFF